ncbi:hypothetical protein R3X27_05140 [Tropicimonas sp. TH_r6]|uniref:hypothetical protein n=1 Tax=Tropicimonas sp. TH_r6 TaxID=3082085 RepID=UPI002952AA0E|nr:hypothetical protein [Tropicimonas sp. TH_r6]MDV7142062.1 hypothetical protein [Tropicimonas sp. TH_r6]
MTDQTDLSETIARKDDEQLPVPEHRLHGPGHFLGLYAAEHVAATEFVIGAAFMALGATIHDILIGLLIGNTLAVLSFWLITAPIAVKTRLSLYTYLEQNIGETFSRLYNGANVLIFVVISAAMITVSATALRALFGIPPQIMPYPTSPAFILIAASASVIAVLVAYCGFNVLSEFAPICAPWLMVMFTAGGMVLVPALNESLTGYTTLSGFVIVIVADWTTANSNLYRAGLAAQAVFPNTHRGKVTLMVGAVVVVGSCFPIIYRSFLPLVTCAGLLLVPIGGIVFAEQQLFPRIGMKTYWYKLSGPRQNVPALVTWGISLIFGFGLNIVNLFPFYYLFVPTWVVSILCDTMLAKRAGAGGSWPEAETRLAEFGTAVAVHHTGLAAREVLEPIHDTRPLSKLIKVVWIVIGLMVPAVLAWRVLFNSPDLYAYFVKRELFYELTIWCTVIYFTFAWWGGSVPNPCATRRVLPKCLPNRAVLPVRAAAS